MKKSVANVIAKHLKEVAKKTTNETAFVVDVYAGLTEKDYYIELTPDYDRRAINAGEYLIETRLSNFCHFKQLVDIERVYGVYSYIKAKKATYNGKEYNICRVTIF